MEIKKTNETPSIERIEGKGLKLHLGAFKTLKAFQAGGQYWEHQSQSSIREYMGSFLPLMQVQEDGESVLCQLFVGGKEVASESRPAKGIPKAQLIKLDTSVKNLKARALAPDVDTNVKKIIEAFKLPDPIKDPELYRLYGSRWNPKLMVVWGCEKEEGSSLAPEVASKRIVKESVGGGFIRKLPIILLILILLGVLAWFISNADFSKKDEVADNTAQVAADNDNTPGAQDTLPNDASETADADADGVGDKSDAFPNDASETADADGDGVGDNADPDALAIEEGPATEEEIEKKRVAIKEAIEKGEPIKAAKSPREATEPEKNLAKLIRPAVLTVVVKKDGGGYTGQGTGFIITEDGIFVTNHHVIEKIKEGKAILSDGRVLTIESELVSDKQRDLALLKLPKGKYPFLRLAAKDVAGVGDKIAVMGSPEGLRNTYSTGIISAERPGGANGVDLLQISAPVSHGSSGSPVVNQEAMVVGIVQGGVTSKHAQALNLAIDVGELHELLKRSSDAVAKSIVASDNVEASNERKPESIPDEVVRVKKPVDGGDVTWQPDPINPAPDLIQPDSRLQLDELDREVLADGKIKIRLKINIKGEKGELSELKDIQCSIDNKKLEVTGSILSFAAEKGDHSLRISWTGQSGKKHAINSNIKISVISVK
jgi:hypothetical protein